MQLKKVSIPFCRFRVAAAVVVSTMLSVTVACGQTVQNKLNNQSFKEKLVWVHEVAQKPDYNVDGGAPYGALYPLELVPSYNSASRNINKIARMQKAGINGVQVLVYGNDDLPNHMVSRLSAADKYPGFMVAPCIAVDNEDQAVRLIKSYASIAPKYQSAAKKDGKLVVFTYGARYNKSPKLWENARNRLKSEGIDVFLVNDTGADLAVNGGLKPELLTPFFPFFDASYMFDDRPADYWKDIVSLFNQYNRAYAGGIMPGYDRETASDGGYRDARATEQYRREWELGLNAGLQWQTIVTWNDVDEHTEIRPTSDWNWTRADITAFYSAKLRGTAFPKSSPQLYVTTPQMIHLGTAPRAEGLILNSSGSTMTAKIELYDGNGQKYGNTFTASVPANSAGAVSIPDNSIVNSFPARRFLRAKASMYDSAGKLVQQVTGAPIVIYDRNEVPDLQKRILYYSIPAAKALPGNVQLNLSGLPVKAGGSAKATVVWNNATSSSNTSSTGQVTLYEHSNFGGKSQSFGTGTYRADRAQFDTVGNDNTTSLKVPAGLKVRVCENENSGVCREYSSGEYTYVEDDLNDKISYMEVTATSGTSSTAVRFTEVLQNTRQVENMFNKTPSTTSVPLTNGKYISGWQKISTSASGFYVGRVIDEQERVGYSDPVYVDSNGNVK